MGSLILYTFIITFSCTVEIKYHATATDVSGNVTQCIDHSYKTKGHNLSSANAENKNIQELLVIDISNCELFNFKERICNICLWSRNVSVNMSWNRIRMLDEVECNCPGISEIDISNNDLTVLRANSFIFAKYVRRIYVAGNHIYILEKHVFNGLKMLQALDLSRNSLRRIQQNVFNSLGNLRTLNLSVNKIQNIMYRDLEGLKSLEVLDLSKNNILSLSSESFTGNKNLKFLNLSENELSNKKLDFLSPFVNLTVADLSRNDFTYFENGSFNGFHINEIILSGLKYLRYILLGSFQNSDFLTKLDISRNKRLVFVENFSLQNLSKLKVVDLSFTKLRALPILSSEMNVNIETFETPLNCGCLSNVSKALIYSDCNENNFGRDCGPIIVSEIEDSYCLFVGQHKIIECFAIGFPKPHIIWERLYLYPNKSINIAETLTTGYFLHLNISSLSMAGNYRCVAESSRSKDYKHFHVYVKHINIGIWVLSRSAKSIVITWNKTHHAQHHVLLYRAFETTQNYVIRRLNDYWKVFIVRSLQPFTEYEICIASISDINDKNCVRTMTGRSSTKMVGIRHNNLAIAVLIISGIVFGVFVVTTIYKCVHKVRIITRQNVFIVGSESRECFADVTESTFTYENQHIELLSD